MVGSDGGGYDPNARSARWAAFWFGIVGAQLFLIQPGIVQGLVDRLGFSERQAGLAAAIEMAGIAVTAAAFSFLPAVLDWRRVTRASIAVAAGATIASAFTSQPASFVALRFIAGLGLGGLVSLSFGAIGLTRDPDRQFAYYLLWALLYGAVALLALPLILGAIGIRGLLLGLAAMTLASLPAARLMPRSTESRAQPNEDARELSTAMKAMALAGVLCYNIGLAGAWSYLFLVGTSSGISEQATATALSASQVAAVAGTVAALSIGSRLGRSVPLTIGLFGGAASVLPLLSGATLGVFTVAVGAFNFLWNLALPYLFASMSSFDRTGRMVVAAVAMQATGLAIGPAVAAWFVAPGQFDGAIGFAASAILVSWLLVFVVGLAHRAALRQSPAGS